MNYTKWSKGLRSPIVSTINSRTTSKCQKCLCKAAAAAIPLIRRINYLDQESGTLVAWMDWKMGAAIKSMIYSQQRKRFCIYYDGLISEGIIFVASIFVKCIGEATFVGFVV